MKNFSYRLLFLITFSLFLFSIVILNRFNRSFTAKSISYNQYKQLGFKYNSLKSTWLHSKDVDKKLTLILNSCNIKQTNINKDSKQIKVKFKTTLKQIDKFINKILNTNFIINQLSIDKNSVILVVEY